MATEPRIVASHAARAGVIAATATALLGCVHTSEATGALPRPSETRAATSPGLRVVRGGGGANGRIVDGSGATVRLHGADRSGTEYACLHGNVFDGPSDQASLDAMKTWNINAVRVPLNEHCWLGINGVPASSSGATYQAAIRRYVSLLERNDMYVILDLHWAAPGSDLATGQLGMADADHAPTFWSEVATAYAADHARVIFDLFNEPFITDWSCWLEGGACVVDAKQRPFAAAGMATMLKAVRSAGASNVVILGGLGYASDFASWVAQVNRLPTLAAPLDGLTTENIAVSWHAYSDHSAQTLCPTQYNGYDPSLSCASSATTARNYGIPGVLAAGYPLVLGEIGIGAYGQSPSPYADRQAKDLATWLDAMLTWVDQEEQSYLGWDWNTQAPPLLISDFDGTPTPSLGTTYKAHLARL